MSSTIEEREERIKNREERREGQLMLNAYEALAIEF